MGYYTPAKERADLFLPVHLLDLRAGVLRRTAEWVSPTARLVRVSSTRMVSFTQRAIVAIVYEVEPLDDRAQVVAEIFMTVSIQVRRGSFPAEAATVRRPGTNGVKTRKPTPRAQRVDSFGWRKVTRRWRMFHSSCQRARC